MHGFPYKHMGNTLRGITLILRHESRVKLLVLIHFACRYKNYVLKCSQTPHQLDYKTFFFFFILSVVLPRIFINGFAVARPPISRK